MKTKDKIIQTSIELFNRNGVVAVTTNHIAKALDISPGNLYFHYENKEEIIRQIFSQMMKENYQIYRLRKGQKLIHPLELIKKNFEQFWRYRFFHREMYYLRRKDADLNKLYQIHISKMVKMTTVIYKRWIEAGWMKAIQSEEEIDYLVNILLATASTFLQFFESSDKEPSQDHLLRGEKYVARILVYYTQNDMQNDFVKFIAN